MKVASFLFIKIGVYMPIPAILAARVVELIEKKVNDQLEKEYQANEKLKIETNSKIGDLFDSNGEIRANSTFEEIQILMKKQKIK